jgi:Asparaginase
MSSIPVDEKQPLLPKQRHQKGSKYVLVIHGGAGTILRERSLPELEARYHAALRAALGSGEAILRSGGEAMDAVVAAVTSMEGMQHQPYRQELRLKGRPLTCRIFRLSALQRRERSRIQLGRFRACTLFFHGV